MIKYIFIIFASLYFSISIQAQAYEIGLMGGAGNYIGDIGRETYFYPNKLGGGVLFKKTINPWFSFRANFHYFQIYANDLDSDNLGRQARRFATKGKIYNFSSGIEYNFMPRNPFNLHESIHKLTPYMFVGLGIGSFNTTLYKVANDNTLSGSLKYDGANINIPMVLGIKYRLSHHFIISIESGAYYYFSDNLDSTGLYYRNVDLPGSTILPTTNTNANDWYTFSSIGLIYTFGDLNCYFNL